MLDTARQFYGDGTGTIATVSPGAAAVATHTLSSDEALQKGYLYPGMIVDVGTLASPRASADSVEISDVDVANKQVTFTTAITTTTNDVISREDNNAASSVTKEIDAGLQKLISTAANTVGTINAAAAGTRFWDNLRDATGGAISLDNLMLNWNKAHAAGARSDEIVSLTTPGLTRRLFATTDFKSNVRFVEKTALKGGFSSLAFNAGSGDVTLVADRLAPYGKVHFVHKKHIQVFSPADWDFLQRDGLTIRWVDRKDAYQALLFRYINLGTNRRNTSLVMSGLTDTGF